MLIIIYYIIYTEIFISLHNNQSKNLFLLADANLSIFTIYHEKKKNYYSRLRRQKKI